jgi:hypothetical protein
MQILAQQNDEQYKIIHAVQERVALLEEEMQALLPKSKRENSNWWRSRNRGSSAADVPLK